jgi:hypothetical protein
MTTGWAILIVGTLTLLIASPGFRKISGWAAIALVALATLYVLFLVPESALPGWLNTTIGVVLAAASFVGLVAFGSWRPWAPWALLSLMSAYLTYDAFKHENFAAAPWLECLVMLAFCWIFVLAPLAIFALVRLIAAACKRFPALFASPPA